MSSTITNDSAGRHLVLPDVGRPVMAKANVRSLDIDWPTVIGRAIQRAVVAVGWSHKEAAGKVGVDDAEFGKWLNGTRRPQFDKLLAVPELREPLVICLAQLADGVEVETVVRIRRTA